MTSARGPSSAGSLDQSGVPAWRGWLIFSAPTFLFFLVQALRSNLTSNVELVQSTFNVGATAFAIASGIYFMVYAPSQLASGLFVDWIGSRYVLAASAGICAASTLIFAVGSSEYSLSFARALSGLGSGVPLLIAIYLASIWLPAGRLPLATGLANGLAALGSFLAIWLLPFIIAASSWSTVMYWFCGIWIAASGLVFFLVPKRPEWAIPRNARSDLHRMFHGVTHVLGMRRFWLLTAMATLILAPLSVVGGLWGTRYLEQIRGWDASSASLAAGMVFVGFAVGSILSGLVGESRLLVRMVAIGSGVLSFSMTVLLLAMDGLAVPTGIMLMFLIGVGNGSASLMYAMVARISGPEHRATGTALILFPVMVFSGVIQAISGWLIDDTLASGGTIDTAFVRALGLPGILAGAGAALGIIGVIHTVLRDSDRKAAA